MVAISGTGRTLQLLGERLDAWRERYEAWLRANYASEFIDVYAYIARTGSAEGWSAQARANRACADAHQAEYEAATGDAYPWPRGLVVDVM